MKIMGFHASVLRLINGCIVPHRSEFVSHNRLTCLARNLAGTTAGLCQRGRGCVSEEE